MDDESLVNDVAHLQARVQAGIGILEDHLHAPAQRAQLRLVEMGDVDAFELDHTGRWLQQSKDGPARSGLSAARLADQPNHFTLRDRQVEPVHRAQRDAAPSQRSSPGGEGHGHIRELHYGQVHMRAVQ